eukprot:m.417232 g.417232  ORF g.417232 m.417232 type:complete len:98 (+) comp21286_c0_seq7:270-563(+)
MVVLEGAATPGNITPMELCPTKPLRSLDNGVHLGHVVGWGCEALVFSIEGCDSDYPMRVCSAMMPFIHRLHTEATPFNLLFVSATDTCIAFFTCLSA